MPMPLSTWIEVDLDRFAHESPGDSGEPRRHVRDSCWWSRRTPTDTERVEMAESAAREGVTHLGVATLHEGLQLRASGCLRAIIVALAARASRDRRGLAAATRADDLRCRGSPARCRDASRRLAIPAVCHVEIDTGMGRIGVRAEAAEAFLVMLHEQPGLRLASLYTHFPDADAADLAFARGQVARFRQLLERLEALGLRPPRVACREQRGRGQRARGPIRLGADRAARLWTSCARHGRRAARARP